MKEIKEVIYILLEKISFPIAIFFLLVAILSMIALMVAATSNADNQMMAQILLVVLLLSFALAGFFGSIGGAEKAGWPKTLSLMMAGVVGIILYGSCYFAITYGFLQSELVCNNIEFIIFVTMLMIYKILRFMSRSPFENLQN